MRKPSENGSRNEASTAIGIFLKNIGKYPLLTKEEEVALADRRDGGDKTAVNEFVNRNLRLIVTMAKKFKRKHSGSSIELLELINEGSIGAMRAAEKFDQTKGFRFCTYASWWIRQAMQRAAIEQGSTVRIPIHMNELLTKIYYAEKELRGERIEPSITLIAKKIDIDIEKVKEALQVRRRMVSLDAPIGGDPNNGSYGELLEDESSESPEDILNSMRLRTLTLEILDGLNPRDQEIIKQRHGIGSESLDGKTLQEIGDVYGLSRERVRQITKTVGKAIGQQMALVLSEEEMLY